MTHLGAEAQDCVFLCDDDNDMELAAVVGKAFLPSVTSVSGGRGWLWVGASVAVAVDVAEVGWVAVRVVRCKVELLELWCTR